MNWFKKNTVAEESVDVQSPVESVLPLVRTMEDDLTGRDVPTKIPEKKEPLISFNPKAPEGAPFYAAPGVETSEVVPNSLETGPFFQPVVAEPPATSSVPEDSTVPASIPPAELPVVAVSPRPSVASDRPSPDENESIALNIAAPGAGGASFEGVLPSRPEFFDRLKVMFSAEKIKWITLGIVVTVTLLSVGGWYFWEKFADKPSIPGEIANDPLAPVPVKPSAPELSIPKYQSDQPNILAFNTETVTAEEIKSALLQAGQEIKKDRIGGAVEFLVRDQKLNPLAFSRFAYLAKLEIPAGILETLDESFSLYVYIDSDRPRAVILAYIKNQEAFSLELQKDEGLLPSAIEPLYLDITTAPKRNLAFRDGMYLERPVRFVNVDTALGLSVDYAIRGKQWVVGTSKNSLRAVLDKTGL